MVGDLKVLNTNGYKPSYNKDDKDRSVFANGFQGVDKVLNSIPSGINTVQYDGFYSSKGNKPEEEIVLENNFLDKILGIFSKEKNEEEQESKSEKKQPEVSFLSLSTQRKPDYTSIKPTVNIFATATI